MQFSVLALQHAWKKRKMQFHIPYPVFESDEKNAATTYSANFKVNMYIRTSTEYMCNVHENVNDVDIDFFI